MKRILVVEDQEDTRVLMELFLKTAGYAVDCARTMTGAREYIRARAYDLVLTDWRLGTRGNGVRVADAAVEKGSRAIIISGFARSIPENDRARHEVLLKPVRAGDLIAAIERQLGGMPSAN